MKSRHFLKLFMVSLFAVFTLVACNSDDKSKASDEESKENKKAQDSDKVDDKDEKVKNKATEESVTSDEDEDISGAVKAQPASETVTFRQVTWFGGPKREANAGVWYYTASDHPEKYEDTFDWEEEDVLLWQIADDEYKGFGADTEELEKMDNDVIKIIVKFDDNAIGDDAPRNYLKVPKGSLEDKSFIVETVEGERLSLE